MVPRRILRATVFLAATLAFHCYDYPSQSCKSSCSEESNLCLFQGGVLNRMPENMNAQNAGEILLLCHLRKESCKKRCDYVTGIEE